ncbi:MAG TPA: outer membrane beta-barrel family protein [Mucilaginibacter sp.]
MKSLITKILTSVLLTVACLGAAWAQPSKIAGRINGSLIDDKGKPMDYATVTLLKAADSSVVKGTLSNDAGSYSFDHVTPGTYIIKATVVGYEKAATKPFSVDGEAPVVAPQLKMQQTSHALNTVTITAAKPLIEHKVDRTVMNVENSVLAAGNSAMEILERAPGVSVDKDDNISIKGKQGVTVMINDKLTYLSSTQLATLLRSTDGTTIQSIEIITNPSAKYDAAGNSGIINIKIKKNKQTGTNGSVTLGAAYGATFKNNENITLNHKEGKLNVFGSFSHDDRKREHTLDIRRIVTDSAGNKTYFNQLSSLPNDNHNNSYRIGADYETSSKNTVGFLINGYFNSEDDNTTNRTNIGTKPGVTDYYQTTDALIHQTYKDFALNLNDKYQIDTAGQSIGIDLDYSKFNNNGTSGYSTYFFLPDGSTPMPPMFTRNQAPSVITIKTAKVDYSLPINKQLKFETGFKLSDVKTDNDLKAQKQVNGNYENDATLTNHFVYTEKVDAGYVNLNESYKNFSVQAGLRGEYTSSIGNSITTNQVVKRNYFDLFPSVFLNQTLNDKNEIGLSYSRRIDRPGYDNLNPFVFYLDQYTYEKGNPYLNPQYTNNFELNYTYNKSVTLTLGYSHTMDAITQVLLTDVSTKATYQTNLNLTSQNNYNINLYAPYTIAKWWTGNANITGFLMKFKADTLLGGTLNNSKAAYQVRTTQTFLIAKGWKAELSSYYNSPMTYGIFNIKRQYANDAGISHSFADKKATIKLSMSDIFNTRRNDVTSYFQTNNLDIRQKNESRVTRLTFTYNFGNAKIKMRQHQSGADDEKGRVKGN